MNKTKLIKELRVLTSAGMSDCKSALEASEWDLQKAVDLVKVKGLSIADGRTGRVATEGLVAVASDNPFLAVMIECNSQTDFVAQNEDFKSFVHFTVASTLLTQAEQGKEFETSLVEKERQALVATTKENIVVRRWHVERAKGQEKIFDYVHSNGKIGVLLTLKSSADLHNEAFNTLGMDLAMQVAAMNPLAVSPDRLSAEEMARQTAIFETQLKELNKPQAAWPKIMEGKMRKWFSEVCLLEQESVIFPKMPVKDVIKNVGSALGANLEVVSFKRYQVGEGLEAKKDNLAEEVEKLMNVK